MRLVVKVVCVAVAVCMNSCGGCNKINEIKQAAENVQEMSKAGEHIQEATDLAQQRHEERRKRGDTLAMPYQELQKYLPESISGYTAQEPSGSTTNMTGMSFSTAKREYVQSSEASGETSRVTVEMFDYNSAVELYTSVTAVWGMNFSIEDDTKKENSYSPGIKDVVGWEVYYKKDKNANIALAVGGRFYLSVKVDGNQSSTDFAKSITKSMKLEELAAK